MSDSIFQSEDGIIFGLTEGPSYSGELTIPEYINGVKITAIGEAAFGNYTNLTSVIIPNGVISIGGYAFAGCSNLSSISFPDSLTEIGEYAFYICNNLNFITIPNNLTTIGDLAFAECTSLTSIYVSDPNNLTLAVSSYDWSNTNSSGVVFLQETSVEYLINEKTLTNLGNEIRSLSGNNNTMTPTEMKTNLSAANAEVNTQADLISQILTALGGKGANDSEENSNTKTINLDWSGDAESTVWVYYISNGEIVSLRRSLNVDTIEAEGGIVYIKDGAEMSFWTSNFINLYSGSFHHVIVAKQDNETIYLVSSNEQEV